MAQKVNVILVDDLDQSEAVETVSFGLDGKQYVIDLNEKHAADLRKALAQYVAVARNAGRSGTTNRGRTRASEDVGAIREWARANGYEVSERGRISAEVRQAYAAAN